MYVDCVLMTGVLAKKADMLGRGWRMEGTENGWMSFNSRGVEGKAALLLREMWSECMGI